MQVEDRSRVTDDTVSLLRRVSFFEDLPEDDLNRVAGLVDAVRVEDGEYVFKEKDPGRALFIVRDGSVDLILEAPPGGRERLAHRRPGETFGEAALLGGQAQACSARAVGETRLLRMDKTAFQELLADQRVALRVLASLSNAVRARDLRLSAQERLSTNGLQAAAGSVETASLSRTIQRGLLPREVPRIPGFDVAAGTSLVDEGHGRTIWDHFVLRDGRRGLASLNVQGERLPAGQYLAVARPLLRELARDHEDLRGLLARVNSGLTSAVIEGAEHYVEAGVVLPSDRGVEWAAAGRCPGAILRRDGTFHEFSSHGPPLGMLDGFQYDTQRMELGAGDAVILLSEATQGLFRGAADLVSSLQGKPVGEVVSRLQAAVKKARPDAGAEVSVVFIRKQ